MESTFSIRNKIVEIGRRMYAKDLVAATDGNISFRINDDQIIISPSGSCLGFLKPTELVAIDSSGRVIDGKGKPTSEYRLHLEVYRLRKDVRAVVHAHPPVCTAFSVAWVSLDECVLPEVVFMMGAIPTTDYGAPTTSEVPPLIQKYIGNCDAMILDRHGTLTIGKSLTDAYYRLEKLEHTARIILAARSLGKVQVLNREQVEKLMEIRRQAGFPSDIIRCVCCNGTDSQNGGVKEEDRLTRAISSEVLKIINGT